jgi:pyruvate dehydrogenase E1 component
MTDLSLLRFWQTDDIDAQETGEWLDALLAVIERSGPERAAFLLEMLASVAHGQGVTWRAPRITPYVNTISLAEQPIYPGDAVIEQRLSAIMRWNALAMVVRANRAYGELGGHIASYASAADLFEVGFNHFFKGRQAESDGDLVFFQAHSAPGIYARAFVEGRLNQDNLAHYRQELRAQRNGIQGLSSYPHPYLMPDFWQFPTGSMGIGPISAIYQARFMRYLEHRELIAGHDRKVWGFFGDGEMDEPESTAALSLAAREGLDNLIFVINCNLQRLDGPVRGNGRIIDELESLFAGAGWNVIKLVWGSNWDPMFARDQHRALARTFADTVDGQFQTYSANDGDYNRQHFFGRSPELAALAGTMTDQQIEALQRGGHDPLKIYAAYARAAAHRGQPTVVLAKTMKGYGMGTSAQGRMTTHQQKKLDIEVLREFAHRFALPLSEQQIEQVEFFKPAENSPELRYLHARRQTLGGYLPARSTECSSALIPELSSYAQFALTSNGREMSTTMAFVRILGNLLKVPLLGPRIVPIVADEARTFGMANLFRSAGIYSHQGQRYEPEDIGSMLYYREAKNGQILEEGITEAGALASWTAAATAYSTHGLAMLPFYIYYSIFGFQRVGDQIWAAADQRSRGFLIGATAGRTTLGGEGLQHQDGSSQLVAATIPNCKAYDPAFAGELAIIIDAGAREMMIEQRDVFYYITTMNENYPNPDIDPHCSADILQGLYLFRKSASSSVDASSSADASASAVARGLAKPPPNRVQLFGSGAILNQALAAADLLRREHQIEADVWSATSYSELAREAEQARQQGKPSFLARQLADSLGPIIAASDYVRAVPEQIRGYLPAGRNYQVLGTDGFGRSDSRSELRQHFGVDAQSIVARALQALGIIDLPGDFIS